MGSEEKRSLEADVEDLEKLDRYRVDSAEWRDRGRRALVDSLDRRQKPRENERRVSWLPERDMDSEAIVIKALSYPQCNEPRLQAAVKKLGETDITKILGDPPKSDYFLIPDDELRLRSAARAVLALACTRDGAFMPSMMYFYYAVVRELYSADAPDWCIGGARAAAGGHVSAYATSMHVRAVLSLARCMERTAQFIDGLAEMEKTRSSALIDAWQRQELQRRMLSLYSTMQMRSWNLSIEIGAVVKDELERIIREGSGVDGKFRRSVEESIKTALAKALKTFRTAYQAIEAFHDREKQHFEGDISLQRTEGAHAVALNAVKLAVDAAGEAKKNFRQYNAETLCRLASDFREAGKKVERVTRPAANYLSSILDRELASAAGGGIGTFSATEMAFAAASVGAMRGWDDERLARAGRHLSEAVTEGGEFTFVRPFHVNQYGGWYNPRPLEAVTSYAQLLEMVDGIPADENVIRRFMRFIKDTRTDLRIDIGEVSTWRNQYVDRVEKHSRVFTAVTVVALDRMNRMLDARINKRILKHFSVREPKKGPSLDDLFYGDYGLCEPARAGETPKRNESLAVVLQKMRAHVRGVKLPKQHDRCFSIVFHGPPGSGKTTVVEALAKSADVPLVEVTPSDIVVAGQEAIERRARAVFQALSLLTRVVILFDEFDPVLKSRSAVDPATPTVFTFLTPGMLPKLKNLHDCAAKRSVAYALVTNLVGSLDAAAIRSGRFDESLGVYPPDLLSRCGYLWTQLMQHRKDAVPPEVRDRFRTAVVKTAGVPMQELTREGWFRIPDCAAPRGSLFAYFADEGLPNWPESQELPNEVEGRGRAAEREFDEWSSVASWDRQADDRANRSPGGWLGDVQKELTTRPAIASAGPRITLRKAKAESHAKPPKPGAVRSGRRGNGKRLPPRV